MKPFRNFCGNPALVVALVAMAPAALAATAEAAPVAMAAHVSGAVHWSGAAGGGSLHPLQRLSDGDIVTCATGASAAVVLFGSGTIYTVSSGRAVVHAGTVSGAHPGAAVAGPSARAVALLGSARVGAMMSRPAHSYQRLLPKAPGYIDIAQPHLEWLPIPEAASYTFTLFDSHDNVVASIPTPATTADYPATAPPLAARRPYLWRLAAFGASGKPLPESRWGLVTFLNSADIASLSELATQLRAQAAANHDAFPLLLLADAYRSYGVTGNALEVLESEGVRDEPGVSAAHHDLVDELSPFVRALFAEAAPANNP